MPPNHTARHAPGTPPHHIRLATEADAEAIHRLNYRTFVEEIPQHPANAERRLVDRFHDENVYAVYEVDGAIVGMVCGRAQRPFSLDQKVGRVEQWLPAGSVPVEIRLLAVEPAFRATRVFARLLRFITDHFMADGYDTGVLSGTTRQLALYEHLGCVPFAHRVGAPGAEYQPMYVTTAAVRAWPAAVRADDDAIAAGGNFLTGPVNVAPVVRAALAQDARSHRSASFLSRYREVQAQLCALTGARHATLLLGSGTLANDVVGTQLQQLDAPGVVVSNGEFGERLVDHAVRLRLPHVVVRAAWGSPLDWDAIHDVMASCRAQWLWGVHGETSTGVVNDIQRLKALAQRHQAKLALDAVSSLGGLPLNLDGVWRASGVSGKSLAAFAGVAIVFHDEVPHAPSVPVARYLDLHLAHTSAGVPFTQSSNLVDALHASLTNTDWPTRMEQRQRDGRWLRGALARAGFPALAPDSVASPIVHTVPLPENTSASEVGRILCDAGWLVGCDSGYLRERNWLQIGLMGDYSSAALRALPRAVLAAVDQVRDNSRNTSRATLRTVSSMDAPSLDAATASACASSAPRRAPSE